MPPAAGHRLPSTGSLANPEDQDLALPRSRNIRLLNLQLPAGTDPVAERCQSAATLQAHSVIVCWDQSMCSILGSHGASSQLTQTKTTHSDYYCTPGLILCLPLGPLLVR